MLKEISSKSVNWVNSISMMLGCLLLQMMCLQVSLSHFSAAGFEAYLGSLIKANHAPVVWNTLLSTLANHAILSLILLIPLLVIITLGLFFSFIPIFPFLMAIVFASFWLSNVGNPDSWLFELMFPSLFALLVGLAQWEMRKHLKHPSGYLGTTLLSSPPSRIIFIIPIIIAVSFAYFNFLAENGGDYTGILSLVFSVLSALFISFSLYRDTVRTTLNQDIIRSINQTYLTIMVSLIGFMLIYQVNADISLRWFSIEGYQNLVSTYEKTSNAPHIVKAFLALSSPIAGILAPIQFVFESLAAICLFLAIFRLPMYWLTTGLLVLLMIIEFGVPADWPPTPDSPVNWLWELLLPTLVLLIASIHETHRFFSATTLREKWLGVQIFEGVSFQSRVAISLFLITLFAVLVALSGGEHIKNYVLNKTVLMAITLFIVMLIIDPLKARKATVPC